VSRNLNQWDCHSGHRVSVKVIGDNVAPLFTDVLCYQIREDGTSSGSEIRYASFDTSDRGSGRNDSYLSYLSAPKARIPEENDLHQSGVRRIKER
jgi:hypothetical protein